MIQFHFDHCGEGGFTGESPDSRKMASVVKSLRFAASMCNLSWPVIGGCADLADARALIGVPIIPFPGTSLSFEFEINKGISPNQNPA